MKSNKGITCFLIAVIVLSGIVDFLIAKDGSRSLYALLMWMPAVAACIASIVVLKDRGEKVTLRAIRDRCGIRKCKVRYIIIGILIPLIYLTVPYIIYWVIFPGSFQLNSSSVASAIVSIATMIVLGTVVSLLTALGEELGWRGFWTPEMVNTIGIKKALAFISVFWCLWHFPMILFDDYMHGTPLWYNLSAFALCIFPVGIMAGILTIRSNSVWPAALLHAAHNNFDQVILGPRTLGENKMFFVSETGIFTIVCAWLIMIYVYVRFRKNSSRA